MKEFLTKVLLIIEITLKEINNHLLIKQFQAYTGCPKTKTELFQGGKISGIVLLKPQVPNKGSWTSTIFCVGLFKRCPGYIRSPIHPDFVVVLIILFGIFC